ncbi:MAG TPA: MCE family protein [Aeromicrobium sp.]|nr:MCE family protein [Aeromicrobium sp.]
MKPFRERNQTVIGAVGIVVILVMMVAAFRADKLPIIGAGDIYYANFSEVGGLHAGNEVRVAGVPVGNVDEIELEGDHVKVTFKLDKGTDLGNSTAAEIRVRTILGATYLGLVPAGSGQLATGAHIPDSRTNEPYDIVDAFQELSTTTDQIDLDQVATALNALSDIAAETPEEFRGAIRGVSDLSANLAARDDQLNELLVNLQRVSRVLNDEGPDLTKLFEDAAVLFEAVADRRDTVHRLLVSTQEISDQLVEFVDATRADIKPVLDQLKRVTDMLRRNESSLDEALRLAPNWAHTLGLSLANGPWWDVFIKVGGA